MSLDLSDILAESDAHHRALAHQDTTASASARRVDVSFDKSQRRREDLQELTRCWVAERCAPELLPWPGEVVNRVIGRIEAQIERVEQQTGNMDPKANFNLIVLQTELERWKFLVRSLLRARLKKIDAHPQHILADHESDTSRLPLLSEPELSYLRAHASLLSDHYAASFLFLFPPTLQKLDDTTGGVSMVEGPELDTAVFVRCLREGVEVDVFGSGGVSSGGDGTGTQASGRSAGGAQRRTVRMKRGDVWCMRWRAVKGWVGSGDVEVI